MQLIMDTELTIDINEKMTTLEDESVNNLKSPEILKKDVTNGNKENIDCKENLIKNTDNVTNGIDKDVNDELFTTTTTEDTTSKSAEDKENTVANKNEPHTEALLEDDINSTDVNVTTSTENQDSNSNKGDKMGNEHANISVELESDSCSNEINSTEHKENSNVAKDAINSISLCETTESEVSGCESSKLHATGCQNSELQNESETSKLKESRCETFGLKESKPETSELKESVCETSELKHNIEAEDSEPKQNNLAESEKEGHVEDVSEKDQNEMAVEEQMEKIFDQEESMGQCSTPDESSIINQNHLDNNKLQSDTSEPKLTGHKVVDPECMNDSLIANVPAKHDNILDIIESDEIKYSSVENNLDRDKFDNMVTDGDGSKETEEKNMDCEDCDTSKDINVIESKETTDNFGENHLECNKSDSMEIDIVKTNEIGEKIEDEKPMEEKSKESNMDCNDIGDLKGISHCKEIVTDNNTEKKCVQEVVEDSKNDSHENIKSLKSDTIDKRNDILEIREIEKTPELSEKEEFDKAEAKTTPEEKVTVCVTSENSSNTETTLLPQDADDTDCIELEQSINDIIEKMDCDESDKVVEVDKNLDKDKETEKCEIIDKSEEKISLSQEKTVEPEKRTCKLSNTLDILSDDEEIATDTEPNPTEKQCINIEDDDDIMLVDEDLTSKDSKEKPLQKVEEPSSESIVNLENSETHKSVDTVTEEIVSSNAKLETNNLNAEEVKEELKEEVKEEVVQKPCPLKPLLPENFTKSYKKNLTEMTRDELEEFCILKIVESIVDRSNLIDIKSQLKAMTQNIEEYKKKAMALTKQNRDLQVVLKSIQEEQKKSSDTAITPLKITRSVGMQVIMQEKMGPRKKPAGNVPNGPMGRNLRSAANQSPKQQKPAGVMQPIPVPRLIPAHGPATKPIAPAPPNNNSQNKTLSPAQNTVKPPAQKSAEKRQHNRLQSVTVDLTDDEPPNKAARVVSAAPVRLVSPQSLLAPQRPFGQNLSSPRKVYIPISGPQNQNIRPGQTIMLKSVPAPRQRCPTPQLTRLPQPALRIRGPNRHPAPLPDYLKQYQPPNWKALPPAPDLKLSKVENGIVISWKIDGYQEDSYEEIASYQLFAYQETASPPSTALWKKIGDVKALPLPMACTLTQFMAGFKYYFAVRAVDVRSRLGPFSLPGSILLLNKM